jgi:predicted PurR-regulated permease PerM
MVVGLAVWLCTVIAEWLDQYRIGRAINLAAAVTVIALALIIALLLINTMVFEALGLGLPPS